MTFIRKGGKPANFDRHFLCLVISSHTAVSYPRAGEYNAPAALAVKVNGKGETACIFA